MNRRADGRNEEEREEREREESNDGRGAAILAGLLGAGVALATGYWLASGRERTETAPRGGINQTVEAPSRTSGGHSQVARRSDTLRCALVVDGANVIHCHEGASPTRFSFEDFFRYGNEIKQAFGSRLGKEIIFRRDHSVFVTTTPAGWRERRDEMGALHESIERSGVSVLEVEMRQGHGGRTVQQGADVAIATKLVEAARERDVDAVILFSGDGDLVHALYSVQQTTDTRIFVCGFRGTVSNALRRGPIDLLHFIDVE
ncbi:unnamed protein product [Vitrella brassicaformis CCMP3155]|uniref:NYN domain-containing protein n=1 Tax=Vitrella brassicaformis (strain CCMP3155) TaxID=1169540 RepID=A0A0G4GEJ2_VITBC|nr:unnamed protein product [Vitrella brassicaformis CCMP3155]|eukprot:CEM27783.1 unnamed protein product [Vitrella brassicaformis CCMP3155]